MTTQIDAKELDRMLETFAEAYVRLHRDGLPSRPPMVEARAAIHEAWNRMRCESAAPSEEANKLVRWLEELRPLTAYGRVGSRDIEQGAMQHALTQAIYWASRLAAPTAPAEPTPASPTGWHGDPVALLDIIERFESKERGIPQAHIAAELVRELRSLLASPAPAPEAAGEMLAPMTVADVLRIVDANESRQDIERALRANIAAPKAATPQQSDDALLEQALADLSIAIACCDYPQEALPQLRSTLDAILLRLASPPQSRVPLTKAVLQSLADLKDEAAAHMWPEDLERFTRSEATAKACSVRLGRPKAPQHTIQLYTAEQVRNAIEAHRGIVSGKDGA